MTATEVLSDLDSTNAWQEDLYVQLHQNPELSMMETETTAEITGRLESYGYDVQQIGGGVVGVMANGEGPTVLFRADIDALPVRETTGLAYASTKTATDADGNVVPVMHACGHDIHMTCLVGVARWLAEHRDRWAGTVVLIAQPAEEKIGGAEAKDLAGTIGIANARLAYVEFGRITGSDRWRRLAAKGAKVQRPLWASTGTKNKAYSDVLYLDSLIGPDTINTVGK